jgi:hypothetical protein
LGEQLLAPVDPSEALVGQIEKTNPARRAVIRRHRAAFLSPLASLLRACRHLTIVTGIIAALTEDLVNFPPDKTSVIHSRLNAVMTVRDPMPDAFVATPGAAPTRVEEGIVALNGMLQIARALAAAGRPIDLSGLDHHVGRLCAQALDLPPEAGRAVRPHLSALLAGLNELAALLAAAPKED